MSSVKSSPVGECPHCGWPVDPGDKCCSECGKPLFDSPPATDNRTQDHAGAADPSFGESASTIVGGEKLDSVASSPGLDHRPPAGREEWTERGGLPPSRVGASRLPEAGLSVDCECRDVVLEVDDGRILVEDMDCPLRIRITSYAEGPTHLILCGEGNWGDGAPFRFRKRWRIPGRGRSREFSISCRVPKGGRGIKMLQWELAFDGTTFEGETEHTVYPADSSASSIAASRITLNIQQGHAGDVHLGKLLEQPADLSLRELIRQIRNAPPRWVPVRLWTAEMLGPPKLPAPLPDACVDRLTLCWDDHRLHLLCQDVIRLGRSRENDVVARCFQADGSWDRDNSLRISSSHATIRRSGGVVSCLDHSKNGSRLDGTAFCQSSREFLCDTEQNLELGAQTDPAPYGLAACVFRCSLPAPIREVCPVGTCPKANACALFLGCRRHESAEDYGVVWCHLSLSECGADFPELRIWRLQEAFAWCSPTGGGWLVPGTSLRFPDGRQCRVEPLTLSISKTKSGSPRKKGEPRS